LKSNLSYSAKVKDYLCSKTAFEVGLDVTNPDLQEENKCTKCCAKSFFYGVTLFSKRLDVETMTLFIENEKLLEICTYVMIQHFLAVPDVRRKTHGRKERFEVSFKRDLIGHDLFEKLYYEENNFAFALECEDCVKYFLRGAFLASGNACDPSLDYRVEFVLKDDITAHAFKSFIDAYFHAKYTKRRADSVVYVKGREKIEDFFALIGAERFTFDVIEKSIEKQKMNEINRSCNCERANIKKTVDASVEVRQAIQKLRDTGRFYSLSDELKKTAEIRERYPDESLNSLCQLFEGEISRSGLSHRLKKLVEIANDE